MFMFRVRTTVYEQLAKINTNFMFLGGTVYFGFFNDYLDNVVDYFDYM